jgi:hypothetical protein
MPYDPIRDFTPITGVARVPNVLVMSPEVAARLGIAGVADLVAYAKKNPGKLNYGSGGTGSAGHLAGEMFKAQAGVYMVHIPYAGGNPAQLALLAGQVDLNFDNLAAASANIKAGKLKALAVTTAARSSAMPDVPTIAEAGDKLGLSRFDIDTWFGIFAPASLPRKRRRASTRPSSTPSPPPTCARASPASTPSRCRCRPSVRRLRQGRARQVRAARQGVRARGRMRGRGDPFDRLDRFFIAFSRTNDFRPHPLAERGRRAPGRGPEPRHRPETIDPRRRSTARASASTRSTSSRSRSSSRSATASRCAPTTRTTCASSNRWRASPSTSARIERLVSMRARVIAVELAAVAYVLVSHWLMTGAPASAWNPVVVVGPMLTAAALVPWQRRIGLLAAIAALAVAGLVVRAWRGDELPADTLYVCQHVAIHLMLALVFGLTLQAGASRWSRRWRGACTAR